MRIASLHPGFENDEKLRSSAIHDIVTMEMGADPACQSCGPPGDIPRNLVRFWHDHSALPEDVADCMSTWDRLAGDGFAIRIFDDAAAHGYILERYDHLHAQAFLRCSHPAMRSDYLRLCVLACEGGLYVDCDDVLLGNGWTRLFEDGKLKLQPLCYDISAGGMMDSANIWRSDLPAGERNFYVNNDPIAGPAGHPILLKALLRATDLLVAAEGRPEIQATTGPGNLTTIVAAHARELLARDDALDFSLIRDWEKIAEMRWDLSYRGDERNWRNVYGC
ncbi:glycosyltransferase [Qipengyuania sp. YIM B01966]|uniref:glycosyltransferase n=1 Tax=Qipengyuania sp. YIM B01966 TaxID=2778646 RepID=UPI001F1D2BF6|nr:glycosyltransferase [Qipengyuania sp. YIM B01966]